MRILHVIYIPRHSGAEILVRDLSRLHVEQGHAVGVVSFFPSDPAFTIEIERMEAAGITWYVPSRRLSRLGRIRAIQRAARSFQADVVVAHSIYPSLYSRVAMLAGRTPVISVLHNGNDNDYPAGSLHAKIEKVLTYRADALVTVSEAALLNYSRNVRRHPRSSVILNGINIRRMRSDETQRTAMRQAMHLADGEKLVLQVGRATPVKRQLETLVAFALAAKEIPTLRLWMVGVNEDATYFGEMQRTAKSLALPPDTIRFLGPRDDVPDLLAACDAYVMPSSSESHSVAFLEGLASGAPVIASRIPSFSAFEGTPGVTYVDPTNAPEYASAIVATAVNGRRYDRDMAAYSIETTADSYMKLFKSVVASS